MTVQTIGHDKLNQLRHVRFFKDINGLHEHMKKHADILRPKFELVLATLDKELNGLGIGEWTKPHGGYFISFDSMEGCAKAIVAKAKEAGVVMTGAAWQGSRGICSLCEACKCGKTSGEINRSHQTARYFSTRNTGQS